MLWNLVQSAVELDCRRCDLWGNIALKIGLDLRGSGQID